MKQLTEPTPSPRNIRLEQAIGHVDPFVRFASDLDDAARPVLGVHSSETLNGFVPSIESKSEFMMSLIGQLRTTLNAHFITLAGDRQKLFCQVGSQPVRVYLFTRVDE